MRAASLMISFLFAGAVVQQDSARDRTSISGEEALELMRADSSILVMDVRTRQEFESETGHLVGSVLLPVQEISVRIKALEDHRASKILLYCRTQNRSRAAASRLRQQGFDAVFIEGGITRWNELGFPVVRGTE